MSEFKGLAETFGHLFGPSNEPEREEVLQSVRDLIDHARYDASLYGAMTPAAKDAFTKLAHAVEMLCDLG